MSNKEEATYHGVPADDYVSYCTWLDQAGLTLMTDEAFHCIQKHGINQTLANPCMNPFEKITIILEELGEAGKEVQYESDYVRDGDSTKLRKELVQVASLTLMYLYSLDES